ncbi:MAG: TetR/AcrR family transcriptional regulator [Hyphomicrobiaceae bacterium]
MPEQTYRQKLKANTLVVARRIVASEGLAGLQARRIAQEAGCSVGTIYNLYDGLDDLILRVNAGTLENLGESLVMHRELSAGQELPHRLTQLALAYLKFALESELAWRAVFEHQFAKPRVVPDWYLDCQNNLFAIVEGILAPVVHDETKRQLAARALFSAVHGIVSLALDQKLGGFDRASTEAQIRFIVSTAAKGVASTELSSIQTSEA